MRLICDDVLAVQSRVETYFSALGNFENWFALVVVSHGYTTSIYDYTDCNWDNHNPIGIGKTFAYYPMKSQTVSTWWSPQNDTDPSYSHFRGKIPAGWENGCGIIRIGAGYAGDDYSYWSGSQRGDGVSYVKNSGDVARGWFADYCGYGKVATYVTPCECARVAGIACTE